MSSAALPKIKVIDTQNLNGSGHGNTAGIDSPSTITDGGQSGRPKSSNSSEGMFSFMHSYCSPCLDKSSQMLRC
jgi:hypothetical protein